MPKHNGPDLKRYMEKRLRIKLNGKRLVSGVLRGYDQFMNLVLDETMEETNSAENKIGMVVRCALVAARTRDWADVGCAGCFLLWRSRPLSVAPCCGPLLCTLSPGHPRQQYHPDGVPGPPLDCAATSHTVVHYFMLFLTSPPCTRSCEQPLATPPQWVVLQCCIRTCSNSVSRFDVSAKHLSAFLSCQADSVV